MRPMSPSRRRAWALVAWAIATAIAGPASPRAQTGDWTVRAGAVRVVCPLTVGGSFEAKSSAITGTWRAPAVPSEAGAGQLTVDLATLDTGIQLRNEHLRDNYLEVGRGLTFARAVLSQVRVTGLDPQAFVGRGTFTGMLQLHGQTKAVAGRVEIRRNGAALDVRAEFPVVLPEFGIPKPRYLGVGVRDQVTVHVTFEAIRP